jgi:hypothetical protein
MQGQSAKQNGQVAALLSSGQKWTTETLERFREYCKLRKQFGMRELRFEEFVIHAKCANYPMPATPNAWGALATLAKNDGLIRSSGKHTNARNSAAHNRELKIWVIQ